MNVRRAASTITAFLFLGFGCSQGTAPGAGPVDSGLPEDGGTSTDAGPSPDAGPFPDSGPAPVDAGEPDSGPATPDAGGFSPAAFCGELDTCHALANVTGCTNKVTDTENQFLANADCATTEQDFETWGECISDAPCSAFDTDAGTAGVCPVLLAELFRAAHQNATCLTILEGLLGSGADAGRPFDGGVGTLPDGGIDPLVVCTQIETCEANGGSSADCANRVGDALSALAAQPTCATTEMNLETWGICLESSPCSAYETDAGIAGACPSQLEELIASTAGNATCQGIVEQLLGRDGG